ncbi:MAG: hypothetical protein GF398_21655 [Chitinivibrionales bacterium]|nr:hypothetical protein [Chitinivibrionales bacterium]
MAIPKVLRTFLFILGASGVTGSTVSADGYELLRAIPSPIVLLKPHFPRGYRAQVQLSGDVAAEIKQAFGNMQMPDPEFVEILDKRGRLRLILANRNYPEKTRELLSGMINPTEMMDMVIASVTRYKGVDQLKKLRKQTNLSSKDTTWNSRPAIEIVLTPTGKRFGYLYEDLGAYVQESWLTKVRFVVDRRNHLVYTMNFTRHARTLTANQQSPPQTIASQHAYTIAYQQVDNHPLPVSLHVHIDKKPALLIEVTYRKENKHLVFDKRVITYTYRNGSEATLSMDYKEYSFKNIPRSAGTKNSTGKYGKRLAKAAELSRKAASALEEGDITAALRHLHHLAESYPETPHAVEAKKLLASLPE